MCLREQKDAKSTIVTESIARNGQCEKKYLDIISHLKYTPIEIFSKECFYE